MTTRVDVRDWCPDFPDRFKACPDFRNRNVSFLDFSDHNGDDATEISRPILGNSKLLRPRVFTSRFSRPTRRRRDLKKCLAIFATNAGTARLSRRRRRRRNFSDQGGDGETKKQLLAIFPTNADTARILPPRPTRRARFSRYNRYRLGFCDQGEDGSTF